MRRVTLFVLLIALFAAAVSLSAQDATPTVTPSGLDAAESTPDTSVMPMMAAVPIRLAHLAADAPALVTYLNGQPSDIQDLSFGAISGWIELPVGSVLTMFPQGGEQSQPVVGPVVVDARSGWVTIAVVGSAQAGTLQAYAIHETIGTLPTDCALVTVINAVEDSSAFDLVGGDNVALASGIGFPGSQMDADAQPDQVFAADNPCASNMTPYGAAECTALDAMNQPMMDVAETTPDASGAMSTADASTVMIGDAGSLTEGDNYANCAVSFLVPGGATDLIANAAGTGDQLFGLGGTQFAPNSYNLVVILGTQDAPQVILYSIEGDRLNQVIANQSGESMPSTDADMMATETPVSGG